ncbi:DUF3846 domain-containing protein [Actinophytocola sediminis]
MAANKDEVAMLALTPDGDMFDMTARQGHVLTVLREAIGCRGVDVVQFPGDLDMWIDDEGLLEERPQMNLFASAVAVLLGSQPHPGVVPTWAGTVVFAGAKGADTVSISSDARRLITGLVAAIRPV